MRSFNRLWFGQSVSLLGTAVTMFALPSLAVLVLHGAPEQIGLLTALETLPFPILGLAVGVLADRWSRRRIMIAADCVRALALGAIPVAAHFGALSMLQLYVTALVTGTAAAFFGIAYQSFLPEVVAAGDLPSANAKLEFSNSGSAMAGNALGGALVQWIGAAAAIGVDAASYIVSVLSLFGIRSLEAAHDAPPLTMRQAAKELGEGLRVVFESRDLRWILGATATSNFGASVINAVFLIYAYRLLHLHPGLLGLADGLGEIGFLGALLSGPIRRRIRLRAVLVAAILLGGAGASVLLFAQWASPYPVIFLATAIVAVSIPVYNVNQVSYRQALVEKRLQGRMNATMRTFVWGTMPLGSLCGGFIGAALGIPQTIAVGAAISAAAAFWLLPLREDPRVFGGIPAAAAKIAE